MASCANAALHNFIIRYLVDNVGRWDRKPLDRVVIGSNCANETFHPIDYDSKTVVSNQNEGVGKGWAKGG